ncbi:F0F1 ATP synthase subunit gamma [Porticoccus sp.]
MSRRRSLEAHRHSLGEIQEIMNSMKTLAYMETRKLARFLDAQQQVVTSIEQVAADFLQFFPETLPDTENTATVYLLIGSDRGFCGDFNHALLEHLNSKPQSPEGLASVLAVGHKLCTLLDDDPRVSIALDGAGVTEEVSPLLNRLVSELSQLQQGRGPLSLVCLYHESAAQIREQRLLPPFHNLPGLAGKATAAFGHPPLLHLPPREFLLQLTEQYLFAVLHGVLFTSLMAENHHRVAHLEGAVRHLEEESAELARACNVLRQEEITEEIEVILLGAENLAGSPGAEQQKKWHK